MEIAIPAPVAGRVRDVFVARNVQVDAGAPLFRIEPAATPTTTSRVGGAAIDLDDLRRGRRQPTPLDGRCEAFVLGFDVDVAGAAPRSPRSTRTPDEAPTQLAILDAFADLCAARPGAPRPGRRRRAARPREHFNTYLRSLDLEREGLPAWFGDRAAARPRPLRRRPTSTPAPALEDALLRIFVAQQRRDDQLADRDRRCSTAAAGVPPDRGCARRSTASSRRPGGATRRSPAWPAACATAASTGRYIEQPAGRGRRPRCAQLAAELAGARSATPSGSTSSSPARCRSCRSSPRTTCSATTPTPGRSLEVLTAPLLQDPRARATCGRAVDDGVVRTSYRHRDRTVHVLAARARRRRARRGARHAIAVGGGRSSAVRTPRVVDLYLARRPASRPTPTRSPPMSAALAAAALPALDPPGRASSPSAPDRRPSAHVPPADVDGVRPYWMADASARPSRSPRTSSSAACTR